MSAGMKIALAYGWAVALVAAATLAGSLARSHLAEPDHVMLYLAAIGFTAARAGRGPSLLASALSVLAYDFFFVPPFFTFTISEERHLLTFAMMFAVGLIISGLTQRIRNQEAEARAAVLRARTEEIRSSLLGAVSHDLRTPLAAITGAATTLRDRKATLDLPGQAELIDTICQEAERLERLVTNLLDMYRLDSGALQVKRDWVPLEEIVGSALTRVERVLAGREVRIQLPPELPLLPVDPVLLEQVLINLLENAAKYTPAASPVDLSARAGPDGGVVVEVADRGPGVPPGAEELVFEKFYRGQSGGPKGAGLGLAICRGIVRAHGGTITAGPRDGGGAVFRIALPGGGRAPVVEPEREMEPAP